MPSTSRRDLLQLELPTCENATYQIKNRLSNLSSPSLKHDSGMCQSLGTRWNIKLIGLHFLPKYSLLYIFSNSSCIGTQWLRHFLACTYPASTPGFEYDTLKQNQEKALNTTSVALKTKTKTQTK